MIKRRLLLVLAALGLLASALTYGANNSTAQGSRTFPETGKTVSGRFLEYWDTNGGLAQQGYPISEEMEEVSDTDGQTYTVQYFERAVFEKHPEEAEPYDVLLSLVGTFYYNEKYGGDAPDQATSTDDPITFDETGKTLGGVFREYWEANGGLAQQGYPVSDEFQEVSGTDGNTYTVQYFQRAVFEYHPEFAGTESEVLLSLLGVSSLDRKYGGSPPSIVAPRTPTPTIPAGPPLAESEMVATGWTHIVGMTNDIVLFYDSKSADGRAVTARLSDDGTLTPLRKFPGDNPGFDSLFNGATHLVPLHNNAFLLYRQPSTDGIVLIVHDDGTIWEEEVGGHSFDSWSHVAADPESRLGIFYSLATGQLATVRWDEEDPGAFANLDAGVPTGTNIPQYRHIVPVGNGNWFFLETPSAETRAYTAYGTSAGQFALLQDFPSFPGTGNWTHVISTQSRMLFYDQLEGNAMTASVAADGTFSALQSYEFWPATWEVYAMPNGIFIFYDPAVPVMSLERLDDNGVFTDLNYYEP